MLSYVFPSLQITKAAVVRSGVTAAWTTLNVSRKTWLVTTRRNVTCVTNVKQEIKNLQKYCG